MSGGAGLIGPNPDVLTPHKASLISVSQQFHRLEILLLFSVLCQVQKPTDSAKLSVTSGGWYNRSLTPSFSQTQTQKGCMGPPLGSRPFQINAYKLIHSEFLQQLSVLCKSIPNQYPPRGPKPLSPCPVAKPFTAQAFLLSGPRLVLNIQCV